MPYKTIFLFSILYDFSNRKIAITRIDTLNTLRSVIKIPFSIFLKPKPRNRKYKEIVIEKKEYENPKVILKRVIEMEDEIQQKLKELEDILWVKN